MPKNAPKGSRRWENPPRESEIILADAIVVKNDTPSGDLARIVREAKERRPRRR